MRSILIFAACTVLATQLFACGPNGTYDPETGATTVTYDIAEADGGTREGPASDSQRRLNNTTETCREEGSDRNYVCIRCDTAHTTTIKCTPRPVVVVGFSQ